MYVNRFTHLLYFFQNQMITNCENVSSLSVYVFGLVNFMLMRYVVECMDSRISLIAPYLLFILSYNIEILN